MTSIRYPETLFTIQKFKLTIMPTVIIASTNPATMKKLIPILFPLLLMLILSGCSIFDSKSPNVQPEDSKVLTENEARQIAESTCIKGGETLAPGYYNENSKTWWFDANLNAVKQGCNPACVVSEDTKTAEINWRCTGLIVPQTSVNETLR